MLAVVVGCGGRGVFFMRVNRFTTYGQHDVSVTCDIQKSIKIDSYTYESIERHHGKNFSDKLRRLVMDYEILKRDCEK